MQLVPLHRAHRRADQRPGERVEAGGRCGVRARPRRRGVDAAGDGRVAAARRGGDDGAMAPRRGRAAATPGCQIGYMNPRLAVIN